VFGAAGAVVGSVLMVVPALGVLLGDDPALVRWSWAVPYGESFLEMDRLSAWFVVPIAVLSAVGAVCGVEFLEEYRGRKPLGPPWFFYNLLVASMVLVVLARNAVLFLVAWEMMTLASFFLVTFENEQESVREAGWIYLVATHLGTAFLMAFFLVLARETGTMDFQRWAEASHLEPSLVGVLFVLAVIGFGTKAGFMPMHVWLPEAHPAAPSHVSALMSGMMIKTGIYGLFRALTFLGAPPIWWGWVLIGIGLSSGILGVLFALAQHDLKRLLAYHSVENIGIIALGLFAVMAQDAEGTLAVGSTSVGDSYPALTPDCPQVHWFEPELAEQWGVKPEGHPWLKPIRFHHSYRPGVDAWGRDPKTELRPCVTDFFQMTGEEVHEVAVSPVHAGIIEPGHFRFQCHGEHVFHLEIALGYQHRGVERALRGGPDKRTIHYMETLAGDTTVGHTTAYCHALESLARCQVPARAQALRAIALELERLANHTGDLGALAGDVGYLPTLSYCGRLRGDFLNMTALLCGSRFGRGLVRPGGVGFDADEGCLKQLDERLDQARRDLASAVNLLWDTSSVRARFENAGALSRQTCEELGLVGVAARACGVERDVRAEFPSGLYRFAQIPVSTYPTGNVFARAFVRWLEIQRSITFIRDRLKSLPSGPVRVEPGSLAPDAVVVSLVEGWRGEICHVALTDSLGRFAHYKVVDPSFPNWMGLALALRDQEISDFPLCNKSFNLSYCGHDL
jgi:Ni,Fe-hydrogenase III large subunit